MTRIRLSKESVIEYQRIEADLHKRIGSGQWAVGAMLLPLQNPVATTTTTIK